MSGYCRSCCVREGGGSFGAQISQEIGVPGLSSGVVSVILRLAVMVQYRRVTDRQTDRRTDGRTHDDS